ncbi:MAG: transporter substrate-binding domain-containing protein [Xanthobacteraceae bacterium]|nr:transporter substrate-binding domain-containing protein [Xanthobacteraceae bacterium]
MSASSRTWRIAHNNLLPPFSELKDGRSVGLVVDIFAAAMARAGISIELVPVPLEQMELSLQDGRSVASFPMAVTPERKDKLDFSDTLLMTGGSLYVRAPEPTPANLDTLAGKTVVTPATGPLAAFIRKTAPDVRLIVTDDYESSLARLVGGEADAAALNHQAGAMIANRVYTGRITMPGAMFLELPLAAAVVKGRNTELLGGLNSGLAAIRADGTWDRINRSWLDR